MASRPLAVRHRFAGADGVSLHYGAPTVSPVTKPLLGYLLNLPLPTGASSASVHSTTMTPDRNPREPRGRHPERQRPPAQGPHQQPPGGGQGPPGGRRSGGHQPGSQGPPSGGPTHQQQPPQGQQQPPTHQSHQPPGGMGQPQGGMSQGGMQGSQSGMQGPQGRMQQPTGTQQGGPMGPPQQQGRQQPMGGGRGMHRGVQLQPVRVEDIVQEDVVTVQPDTPLTNVVSQMADRDVGSVVVVEDDEPQGVVTDRKIALALDDRQNIEEMTARDLTDGGDLVTGSTEMSVFDALQEISDAGIRRLPVVDDGELQGIVTLDDVLVLLGSELNKATEVIRKQSPRY